MAPRSTVQRSREHPVPGSVSAGVVSLPLAPLEDAELLRQLGEGRPAAFRELFDRYARLLRGLLVRMLGVDSEIDDLVQESLIVVVKRSSTVRDPRAFRSFVYSVGVRVARNELRRRAVRRWVPWDEDVASVRSVAAHDPVLTQTVRHIYQTLDRLGPDLRVAFVLRFVEGRELTEAAALSGTSLATFKRRLSRATERFELLASRDPVLARWIEERRQP